MIETVTPSGLAIRFQDYPRGYHLMVPDVEVSWLKVPSVTTVLRILERPALMHWAWKVGVEGFVDLIEKWGWKEDGLPDTLSKQKAVDWMKREKLTLTERRNSAGERGKAAHDALERFLRDGEIPDPRGFPKEDRGFVAALKGWLEEAQPKLEMAEVMVGSRRYEYAGRFDLLAWIGGELWLLDLKTSESPRVYDEALIQLAGYEGCMEEDGYPIPTRKAIVCVGANGKYVVKESFAKPRHFRGILACWQIVNEVRELHSEKVAA